MRKRHPERSGTLSKIDVIFYAPEKYPENDVTELRLKVDRRIRMTALLLVVCTSVLNRQAVYAGGQDPLGYGKPVDNSGFRLLRMANGIEKDGAAFSENIFQAPTPKEYASR